MKKNLYTKAKNGNIIFPDMKSVSEFFNIKAKPMIDQAIEDYHKKLEQAKEDATKEALILMLPIACTSLNESYNFSEVRLQKFIDCFENHMSCINEGVTNLEQYKEFCKDEGWKFFDMEVIEK